MLGRMHSLQEICLEDNNDLEVSCFLTPATRGLLPHTHLNSPGLQCMIYKRSGQVGAIG